MSQPFNLPAELTIYTAESTRQALLGWLQVPADAGQLSRPLHGAEVSEVDGAGLQLLGSLANSLAAQGQTLELHQPSPVLRQALMALGCGHWFPLIPSEATA
ncbi:STAS domain-containing protein [Curvibacter sp. HBC61]|uniref:STAS domain-containing protein n=1 Tax=Curvibacter cyanobacteriorum TaxID=3026422 RepID=A0ABT5MTP8_9BURK|nr:STAS domain-containing protein [Curvibacter sp. HBC61]MDD0837400.1 STAS domain-containing protein [Curvibacter sp. HBC61]